MSDEIREVSPAELSEVVTKWRLIDGRMHLLVDCDNFSRAMDFVAMVAEVADDMEHHPDIDIRYNKVHLVLSARKDHRIAPEDVTSAKAIGSLVKAAGLTILNEELRQTEISIAAKDIAVVLPFWQAVLGYEKASDHLLVDPNRLGPDIVFAQLDEALPDRGRVSLNLYVPHDQTEQRLKNALVANGYLLSKKKAPAYWVLADEEGNEVTVNTWQAPEAVE